MGLREAIVVIIIGTRANALLRCATDKSLCVKKLIRMVMRVARVL